ncbi:hypothetical protein EMCG_02406 [[Emmonsia] crescens]|uniref:Uncharacterized protein n=1 Tax=[Emmonsia] crescens TaxID=73230 RepID=A0A0G2J917_9EURO|nr:hypothetical protein EMCG_02406 [Emmonsia crescens UAMH 3008]
MNSPITISNPPYTYTNNTLFISSSGNNQHRRATLPELNDLFNSTSSSNTVKDPPAHWYEAQLRFYGLDVSKTKSVAKMRLFDAVRSGGLVVPDHIKEIEGKMEKEWKTEVRKQSQAKKKEAGIGSVNNAGGKGKGKGKRKADDIDVTVSGDGGGYFNVNVSVNVGAGKGKKGKEKEKDIKAPAAKKVKTAKTDTGAKTAAAAATQKNTAAKVKTEAQTTTKITAPKAKPDAKTTAKKNTATTTTNTTSSSASTSRRGGTTRRGRGGLANVTSSGGRAASAAGSSPPPPPRRPIPRQTARRSRPFPYPGRTIGPGPSTTSNNSSYPDPPLPYSTSQDNYYYNPDGNTNYSDDNNSYSNDDDNNDNNYSYYSRTPSPSPGPGGPLGLLNGRYSLESPALRDWAMYDDHPFTLILTLHQNALWGAYDFGMFTGILHIPQRPWEASADKQYEFSWRGKENSQGVISYDDARQKGWIRFLGNGRIDGVIEVYGKARFSGVRVSGEQTRSERDAASMRAEWEGYSQEAYEHARVARWR